jgi:hypothetical protein
MAVSRLELQFRGQLVQLAPHGPVDYQVPSAYLDASEQGGIRFDFHLYLGPKPLRER